MKKANSYMAGNLFKRNVIKFVNRHIIKLVFIGLPLLGMFVGIFIGMKVTGYAQSTKLNDYGRQVTYVSYRVQSGDTIWRIASDLAALNPEYNSIQQYVSAIKETNGLYSNNIEAGRNILIPYYTNPGSISMDKVYEKYGIGR